MNRSTASIPATAVRPLSQTSVGELVDTVRAALATHGIIHVRTALTRSQFFEVASAIGTVWRELLVAVRPDAASYVHSTRHVDFHCDAARANLLAWLYEVPDSAKPVRSSFLDAREAYARLSPDERTWVERTHCSDPLQVGTNRESDGPRLPVVWEEDGTTRFFWIARLVEYPTDPVGRAAVEAFARHVSGESNVPILSVVPTPGEAIFVDNNRFLHARDSLSPASERRVYRLYINTDGWAEAQEQRIARPMKRGLVPLRPPQR